MNPPSYSQWPGFRLPIGGSVPQPRPAPVKPVQPIPVAAADEVPDHHTQLEELIGHVRRCERWALLDDRIDLSWRLDRG